MDFPVLKHHFYAERTVVRVTRPSHPAPGAAAAARRDVPAATCPPRRRTSEDTLFHHFGVLRDDYSAKPAFGVLRDLIAELGAAPQPGPGSS